MGGRGMGAVALLWALAACGDPAADAPAAARADSAGVEVVTNAAPPEARWGLGDAAVDIDGSGLDAGAFEPVTVAAGADGRVLVADAATGAVLAFDADGRQLWRSGDELAGDTARAAPALRWALPYRGDSVAAFDQRSQTLRILAPDGTLAREVAVPTWRREGAYGVPGYAAGAVAPMADGGFLTYATGAIDRTAVEGPNWYRHDLLRLAADGARHDTLGTFEVFVTWLGPNGPEPFPFAPVAFRAPYDDGFVFARGDHPEVRIHGPDGSLRRIVRWGGQPPPVNAADLEAYRAWYLERAGGADALDAELQARLSERLTGPIHPERRPALSNLLVDDEGNVWVEDFRWVEPTEVPPEPRPAVWNVLDPEGVWIARVEVPAGFLVTAVQGGRVHGVLVAPDGTRSVRVHPLVR